MKQVKRYKVVQAQTLLELESEVEKAIWRGYVPTGGILLHPDHVQADGSKRDILAQAMYMSEEEYDYRMESVEKISNLVTDKDDSGRE